MKASRNSSLFNIQELKKPTHVDDENLSSDEYEFCEKVQMTNTMISSARYWDGIEEE